MSTTDVQLLSRSESSLPLRQIQDAAVDVTAVPVPRHQVVRKDVTAIIVTSITGVTLISSLLAGLVTISLPAMARELQIPDSLLLWPASIYALTCGCTLILAGAVADVVGSRTMYLLGALLQSAFTLGCGLARNTAEMLLFRALAGIAISFCLPSAVSLILTYFPSGKRRNIAFGAMGGGQPIGFSIGLAMGGVLTDKVGWRSSFYIAAGINTVVLIIAVCGLPKIQRSVPLSWARLKQEVDWIGAFLLSSSLALLSYVFATLTTSVSHMSSPESIVCLSLGFALLPAFVIWANRRERQGKAVLIRNSLWRNKAFTSICLNVFLVWGAFNATETLLTFVFQDVQSLSATEASIRFLPAPISGVITNLTVALLVHKVNANWALLLTILASAVAPLLLAIMPAQSPYWEYVFPAVALNPIGPDTLYTISNLVITAEFNENTQALAGGVFNTVAQIGKSVGLALSAVIASSVTRNIDKGENPSVAQLFQGYQAAWWFIFATTVSCIAITVLGLRGIGKVGMKRE